MALNEKYKRVSLYAIIIGAFAGLLFILFFFVFQFLNGQISSTDSKTFGIGADTGSSVSQVGMIYGGKNVGEASNGEASEASSLVAYPERDISPTLTGILTRREEAAKAAAEAARIDEINHISQAKNNRAKQAATVGLPPLSEINWDAGKAAFLAEWTGRINKYLNGSPLAGQGAAFAEAAWENGIDPRWSPAISNTESGKGSNCFASHNAWGWGSSSWPDWPTAISSHVNGLASKYGYSIAKSYAETYCPPNSDNWYNNTLSEMSLM